MKFHHLGYAYNWALYIKGFISLLIDLWTNILFFAGDRRYKENLINANFFLYSLIATFLFPGTPDDLLKKDSSDIIDQTVDFMRTHIDKRLSVREMAEERNISNIARFERVETLLKSIKMTGVIHFKKEGRRIIVRP